MEAEPPLHRRDPFALGRLGDDRRRLAQRAAALERLDHLLHVVAVDLDRVPPEGLELRAHVADVHDLLGGPVGLQVVVVDDRRDVGDAEVDRGRRGLPRLALLAVAVGEDAEDLSGLVEAVEAQREGDPEAHRESLPERAGRDLDPRRAPHVRVALELGADLAEPHEVLEREVGVLRERRVLDRRRMALAEDEAVALRPVRVVRVVAKDPVVERGDDVGRRQRGVEVAGLGDREHSHAVDAQDGRPALELGDARLRLAPLGEPGRRLGIRYRRQVPHGGEVSVRLATSRASLWPLMDGTDRPDRRNERGLSRPASAAITDRCRGQPQ